ncbi:MAG TPA: PIG-L family deacetylase [Mycobacteriales bacterium]
MSSVRTGVRTIVSFHAHPDDEALLTAGTLARLAAEGHRVVLVVATAGAAGLVSSDLTGDLAAIRTEEVRRSARLLGCARVVMLGYDDSGLDGRLDATRSFAHAEVDVAAARLAAVLDEERADAVTIYDAAGGYGHPDHVQVHHVGARAAQLAGTPMVLEATVDRDLLQRALRLTRRLPLPADFDADRFATAYTPRSALTHRVDVRRYAAQKRAAMAAHATQLSGGTDARTLRVFLRLPRPVFRAVFGHEWFVEHGRTPSRPPLDDVLAGLTRPDGHRPGANGRRS